MDELRDFLKSRGKITLTLVMVNILIFFVMDFTGNTEKRGVYAGTWSCLRTADPGKWRVLQAFYFYVFAFWH